MAAGALRRRAVGGLNAETGVFLLFSPAETPIKSRFLKKRVWKSCCKSPFFPIAISMIAPAKCCGFIATACIFHANTRKTGFPCFKLYIKDYTKVYS